MINVAASHVTVVTLLSIKFMAINIAIRAWMNKSYILQSRLELHQVVAFFLTIFYSFAVKSYDRIDYDFFSRFCFVSFLTFAITMLIVQRDIEQSRLCAT